MPAPDAPKLISLVVPVFNEEQVIAQFLSRVAEQTGPLSSYRWELVLIDDGSADATVEMLKCRRQTFPGSCRLVQFARNFGHQSALQKKL